MNKNSNMASKEDKITEKPLNLDNVLVNELGQFGRFQFFNAFLVTIPMFISAFLYEYVFSAGAIPHRCFIPECEENSTNSIYDPDWIYNAVPEMGIGLQGCSRYAPIQSFNITSTVNYCPIDAFNQSQLLTCDELVYSRDNTAVYDFYLGCQEWNRALAGTINSIGALFSLPISGIISDRYGRRLTLVICVFSVAFFGVIRAFSVNYPMYLALQFLQTAGGGATVGTSYIFAAELVGPKYRLAVGVSCSTMFALGQVALGGIAWLVPNWRKMTLVLFAPCFVLISYYWLLSESVRWLLSKGKCSEATKILQKVAKVNKKEISENTLRALSKPHTVTNSEKVNNSYIISKIISSPILLRRVCTTPIWWLATTFIYYGLNIESTSLSGNMYLNYMLVGAVELPGFLTAFLVVNRIGRKPTLFGGYFLCAACNIAFAFVPQDRTVARLLLYLLGKYGIATVFTSLYLYTSELYPTEYRQTLLAFSSMIGRIGSVIAPLTPALKQYWIGIPSILFGCFGLLSGFLILTQPETKGTKLPDTLAEAERLGTPESKLKQIS